MTLRRILVTLTTTAALSLFSAGAVAATPLAAQGRTADPPTCSAQVSGEKPKISAEPDQNVAQQMTSSADGAVRSGADELPAGVGQVASRIAVALGIGSVPMVIAGVCGGSYAGAATGVGAGISADCIGGIATLVSAELIVVTACFGYV